MCWPVSREDGKISMTVLKNRCFLHKLFNNPGYAGYRANEKDGEIQSLINYMRHRIILLFFAIPLFSCRHEEVLQEVKKLPHYPSASGVEFVNGHFYIIGDDARQLLVLDSSLAVTDSIPLYHFPDYRIPKDIKPDLEAVALLPDQHLLVTGSGSASPQRDAGWLIDPVTKQKDSLRLDTFYRRISRRGITEINIEGAAMIPGALVLSNRGSKGFPKNHLLFTKDRFWENPSQAPINPVLIGFNTDTSFFNGVSGLAYAPKHDQLIITVSTEDTRNNTDDGAIGKSYLWIVKSISSKTRWKAINPDRVIDLEKIDARFRGQKIESACVWKETRKFLYLLLVADNDDGSSTLFRLVVPV